MVTNKYQLLELISQGDQNLVYKAYEPARQREVAIKYLSPAASLDPAASRAFRQEMQLIAALDHSHILPVYDYGIEEGRLYLVTPYIEGGTLQARLSQFHSLPRAYQLLAPIADALDYVHTQGLVHGNLKPSNVLLDETRQPMLTDFGAFQKMGERGFSSPYQSPEQAQDGPIDARTDVYALGALLYAMLIGQPPLKGTVPSPHSQRPDLPVEVEQVILTAMAQDPAHRFQTAGEFSQALETALTAEAQPVAAETEDRSEKGFSWWGVALAGVALVVLAGLLLFFLFGGRSDSGGGSTIIIEGDIIVVPTPVPGQPALVATTNVNIRTGPGLGYELIGILKQGQTAEVIGLSPDSGWWTIKVEAAEGGQGWVSAQFVTAENAGNVPVIQPPPLPQPTTAPPVTFTGWRGEYFNNRDLNGSPVLVRDDPAINFNWGDGSPAPELPADNFSARWTISRQMPAGTYRFSIWVDDGARLFVDDRLIIDAWQSGSPRNYMADVGLASGNHTVRLEYFEVDGGALISLGIGYLETPATPEPGEPPLAVIDAPAEVEVGQNITFDAGRSEATNPIAGYAWDFGDGSRANAITLEHVYNRPGLYNVVLIITDDQGLEGRTSRQIQVNAATPPTTEPEPPTPTAEPEQPAPPPEETSEPEEPAPPTAMLTASVAGQIVPPVDQTLTVPVSRTVTFDGSRSQPGSSAIANYGWAFDGVPDPTTGPVVTQTYEVAGSYQVTLTVTDEDNQNDSRIWQVQVTP